MLIKEDCALRGALVDEKQLEKQKEYALLASAAIKSRFESAPKAFVHTYGCQGNVADSERIQGILCEIGYELTSELSEADLVLYNTCAVREHAEQAAGACERKNQKKLSLCKSRFRHSCASSPARIYFQGFVGRKGFLYR